jgi:hypothetical protein
MKKIVKINWLPELGKSFNNRGEYTLEHLEQVVETLDFTEATYAEFDEEGNVDFYKKALETEEEFEKRMREKEATTEFIEKLEYQKALETIERLEHKFLK